MGNLFNKMEDDTRDDNSFDPQKDSLFLEPFLEDTTNGLYLKDTYFPDELVTLILSHVPAKDCLKLSLVCKNWFDIIRSTNYWQIIYKRTYNKNKAKKLPWFVYYALFATGYFNRNLLRNGNGEKRYQHWEIVKNYGDEFKIEDPPVGCDPLPVFEPDFNNKTSCFATSFFECNKLQRISFVKSKLMRYIFDEFHPKIFVSEWVTGRFDCGCTYKLTCKLVGNRDKSEEEPKTNGQSRQTHAIPRNIRLAHRRQAVDPLAEEGLAILDKKETAFVMEQWAAPKWTKVTLLVENYPKGVHTIVFQHEGKDTQFWKGHYGSKMAGGVVKILFDSIEDN